jgi:hypothetical protein
MSFSLMSALDVCILLGWVDSNLFLEQIVQNCPADFLEAEALGYLVVELLLAYIFNVFQRSCLLKIVLEINFF